MNVFEYSKQHGGTNGFIPKPPTGDLMNDQTPHAKRLEIMAARLERGESLFHPTELRETQPSKQGCRQFIELAGGRAWKLTTATNKPSEF